MPRKELHRFGGPGGWNDPDYLLLGYLSNWKGKTVPTPLTPDEQYAHVSLWCLLAAPLIFSGDITRLDDFTLGLLCNDEVIDVDQDSLGRPVGSVAKDQRLEVWAKDMEDGSLAVGLFNRGECAATVTAQWADLGLSGPRDRSRPLATEGPRPVRPAGSGRLSPVTEWCSCGSVGYPEAGPVWDKIPILSLHSSTEIMA